MTTQINSDLRIIDFWSTPMMKEERYSNIDVKLMLKIRDVKKGSCMNCYDATNELDSHGLCVHCQ